MKRNIRLSYIAIPLSTAWFWLGIWLIYYLRITDYAGVGLIEMSAFFSAFIFEIPTGAFADLLGKKKTLMLAFLFMSLGNLVMYFAGSLAHLVISVIAISLGSAFSSGTSEAFIYDSLKEIKKENEYEKIFSNLNKYKLLVVAGVGIIGGFVYKFNPGLPFLLTSLSMFIAFIISFFFIEPKIDTVKYSLINYLKQNIAGFKELFTKKGRVHEILLLLTVTSFIFMVWNVFDFALANELKFDGRFLGIIFAGACLVNALGSNYYPTMKRKFGKNRLFTLSFFCLIGTTLLSPYLGIFLGGTAILIRNYFYIIPDIIASNSINESVASNVRATTLSTFAMLKGLPYAMLAYPIGVLMDIYKPSYILFVLSAVYFVIVLILNLINKSNIIKLE